jgi:hypothetical protein
MSQVEIDHFHQLSLGANTFKERDELEFEENHKIDGWAPHIGVEVTHQIADKTQINALFDTKVEIVIWNEFV